MCVIFTTLLWFFFITYTYLSCDNKKKVYLEFSTFKVQLNDSYSVLSESTQLTIFCNDTIVVLNKMCIYIIKIKITQYSQLTRRKRKIRTFKVKYLIMEEFLYIKKKKESVNSFLNRQIIKAIYC